MSQAPADIVNIMGHPQTKIFTRLGDVWSSRRYVPTAMFRSGLEKILSVRVRESKVDDLWYTLTAP